jgi:hypothetical protein
MISAILAFSISDNSYELITFTVIYISLCVYATVKREAEVFNGAGHYVRGSAIFLVALLNQIVVARFLPINFKFELIVETADGALFAFGQVQRSFEDEAV